MAVTGFSGKDGCVKIGAVNIAELTRWEFTMSSNNPAWGSSDTGGYKTRVAGVKDGTGSMEGKFSPGATTQFDVIAAGTAVDLLLHVDGTGKFTVPSIIDNLRVNVDVNDGEPVEFSADFSITGAYSHTKNA